MTRHEPAELVWHQYMRLETELRDEEDYIDYVKQGIERDLRDAIKLDITFEVGRHMGGYEMVGKAVYRQPEIMEIEYDYNSRTLWDRFVIRCRAIVSVIRDGTIKETKPKRRTGRDGLRYSDDSFARSS